jgi:rod shape-determining protein MreD
MKQLFFVLLIFLAFFFQGKLSVLDISPDLTALLVFYAGIRFGGTKGLLLGVLVGGIEDSLSASIIGPNILAKGMVGFSAFFISRSFFTWTPLLGIIAVALITFFDNSAVFLSRSVFDRAPATVSSFLFVSVMQSLLNAPAGAFIRPENAE